MYCENCGTKIDEGEKFCPCCGASVQTGGGAKKMNDRNVLAEKMNEKSIPAENRNTKIMLTASVIVIALIILLLTVLSLSGSVVSKKKGEDSFGACIGSKLEVWILSLNMNQENDELIEDLYEDLEELEKYDSLSPSDIIGITGILLGYMSDVNEELYNQYVFTIAILIFLLVVNGLAIVICAVTLLVCIGNLLAGRPESRKIGDCAVVAAGAVLFEAYMSAAFIKIINEYSEYSYGSDKIKSGEYMLLKTVLAFLLLGVALIWSMLKTLQGKKGILKKERAMILRSVVLFAFAVLALTALSSEVLEIQTKIPVRSGFRWAYVKDWIQDINIFDVPLLFLVQGCENGTSLTISESVVVFVLLLLVFAVNIISVGFCLQTTSSAKNNYLALALSGVLSIVLYVVYVSMMGCGNIGATLVIGLLNAVLIAGAVGSYCLDIRAEKEEK